MRKPRRFATGGTIRSYSPGDDSVPAMLSRGCPPLPRDEDYGLWMQTAPIAPPPWFIRAWFRVNDVVRFFRTFTAMEDYDDDRP